MNGKIEILSRDRNCKEKISEIKNPWMAHWQNENDQEETGNLKISQEKSSDPKKIEEKL